jgi:hypothetical protein
MRPLLADASVKPSAAEIAWTRDAFLDLLRIRGSSTMFGLRSADEVQRRLRLLGTGAAQEPSVVGTFVDGRGLAVAACAELACFVNAGTRLARSTTQLCAARPSGCIRCTRPAPMRALAMPPSTPM